METYFAYGSNLSMKQMKERCPSVRFLSKAVLPRYQLVFALRSKRWGGGVAGIVPEPAEQVEGIVYQICKEDLERLDEFEGTAKGQYSRGKVNVILPNGASMEAWTFFANPEEGGPFRPSKKYLETILEGVKEHRLSEQFMEELKELLSKSASSNADSEGN